MPSTSSRHRRVGRRDPALAKMGWFKPVVQIQALLVVALLFGGGGVAYGIANLVVQLTALALLAFNADRVVGFFGRAPMLMRVLVMVTLALPLLQVVPLPSALWSQLPGRELVEQSLALIGQGDAWFPVSVDRNRTLVAFFSLIPVLAVLVLGWELEKDELEDLSWTLVALGLAVTLLGTVQLVSGNSMALFFPESVDPSDLYGTFANHNTTGIFLDIVLVVLIGMPTRNRGWRGNVALRLGIGLLLALAVVLTRSRSSIAILLPIVVFAGARYLRRIQLRGLMHKWSIPILMALCFVVLAAGYVATSNMRLSQSFSRFDTLENERPHIWEDTVTAIHRYWPVGSGTGTFDEVFQVDESLEYVTSTRAGRAHNDYLEVTLESGIFGLVVMAGWLFMVTRTGLRALRRRHSWSALSGGVGLGCIALQALLDYPLRNETMLCSAGLMLLLLLHEDRSSVGKTG